METEVSIKELTQMRENIRTMVFALEMCWCCEKIAECRQALVDDGALVWLCEACWVPHSAQKKGRKHPGFVKCCL